MSAAPLDGEFSSGAAIGKNRRVVTRRRKRTARMGIQSARIAHSDDPPAKSALPSGRVPRRQSERRAGEVLGNRPCGGLFSCWSPSGPCGPSSARLEAPSTALPTGTKVRLARFSSFQGNNGTISRVTTDASHPLPDAAPPVLRAIAPAAGPKEGGTTLTITGSGFRRSKNLKVRSRKRRAF